jgi:Putative zinc-finger
MSECTNGEMRDLLPELVSGRLSAEMQLAVEAHVAECEECVEELTLLRALRPALMRGPVVDAQRIAAAVRAQVPESARRGSSGSSARWSAPWRLAIAAAALLAVSAVGYVVATRGRSAPPEIAVVHTVDPHTIVAPAPTPAPTPRTAPSPAPQQQVAAAPQHVASPSAVPTPVASVGVLDNLSDLSDDDVRTLTASLDGMSAVPDAEPASGIDPLGAALDDQSAGGS